MNPIALRVGSRRVLGLLAISLIIVNGAAVVTLAWTVLRPRSVILTPMVNQDELVVPGQIPPEAVSRFVAHWLYYLEDWTTPTLKDRSNYVLRYTHQTFAQKALKALQQRLEDARRGQQASQLIIPPPEDISITTLADGRFRAVVRARRLDYIADRLQGQWAIEYTVTVVPVPRSEGNRFGFVVAGFSPKELKEESADDEAGEEGSSS